jgi:hypothetical protein
LQECFERVASSGSLMFDGLCARSAGVRELLAYVDQLPSGTRLTIMSSDVLLPFEMLHSVPFRKEWPEEKRRASPVPCEAFWGVRFALEVVALGAQNYAKLMSCHARAPRAVSLNLNATIRGRNVPGPAELHDQLTRDLAAQGVECESGSSCPEVTKVLLGAQCSARLVYVYCHGSPAAPASGTSEQLDFGGGCAIRPGSVYPDSRYASAPIVFLNACYGSACSPLFFTGFLDAVQKQGALGLIASNFPVPIMFGARFGGEVVKQCLLGSGALGERLRRLRAQFASTGNPVPLFYSAQCQIE